MSVNLGTLRQLHDAPPSVLLADGLRMLPNQSDRQWPSPEHSPALRMKWHDLLFMHWPLPVETLRPLIPPQLQIDIFDGMAWIGVVPFRMSDVAPTWAPSVPGLSAFPELNVRTYVRLDGDDLEESKPGVWFFSLDATNPIAVRVARWLFHLNYIDAVIRVADLSDGMMGTRYESKRRWNWPVANLRMSYRSTGQRIDASQGLERWLTCRYCMYTADKRGRILRGEIEHAPWQLESAECDIDENSMTQWLGFSLPKVAPHLLYSRELSVRAWTMSRI